LCCDLIEKENACAEMMHFKAICYTVWHRWRSKSSPNHHYATSIKYAESVNYNEKYSSKCHLFYNLYKVSAVDVAEGAILQQGLQAVSMEQLSQDIVYANTDCQRISSTVSTY